MVACRNPGKRNFIRLSKLLTASCTEDRRTMFSALAKWQSTLPHLTQPRQRLGTLQHPLVPSSGAAFVAPGAGAVLVDELDRTGSLGAVESSYRPNWVRFVIRGDSAADTRGADIQLRQSRWAYVANVLDY
jgi:hypothetical protein